MRGGTRGPLGAGIILPGRWEASGVKAELKSREAPQPTYLFHARRENGSLTSCSKCENNLHELTLCTFKAGPQRQIKSPPLLHVDLFQRWNTVDITDVMTLTSHLSQNTH